MRARPSDLGLPLPKSGHSAAPSSAQPPYDTPERTEGEVEARAEACHAVAENVPFRAIAEAIGQQPGVPERSLAPGEAEAHFGPLARWAAGGGQATREATRAALGWEPREVGLIADIDRPEYHG